jgi:hypothetical protein
VEKITPTIHERLSLLLNPQKNKHLWTIIDRVSNPFEGAIVWKAGKLSLGHS